MLPPPERGAGNFALLLEDNLNDASDGASSPIPGDAAGHNVVAPGYGLTLDPRWTSAPGGDYPASRLGCTSCHDAHGSEAFRFLFGKGPIDGGAYLTAVPFEDPFAETSSRQGPSISSRLMCLTCHRAHASSAPHAGRWDFRVGLLKDDGLVSGSWPIPDPYNSPAQGPLCGKCHAVPQGANAPRADRPLIPLIRDKNRDRSRSR